MPGRGPAPKAERSRPNDTARRQAEMTLVAADGDLRGPDLPDGAWHPRTLDWWDTWRRSAQAQMLTPTDWDVLMETAILHTELWNGDTKVAPELRLRVAKFGATVEDRLRLKLQVDSEVKQAVPVAPAAKADRRKRLLKAVADGAA